VSTADTSSPPPEEDGRIDPPPTVDPDGLAGTAVLDTAGARRVTDAAIGRYFEGRRAKVDAFVDHHFSIAGTLRIHRAALGWDMLRAPANVLLAVPTAAIKLSAVVARKSGAVRAGDWLDNRSILFRTAVDREIEWLIHTELLELPYQQGDRQATRDALAEEMLRDPVLVTALAAPLAELARHANEPDLEKRLSEVLRTYAGTRVAATDLLGAIGHAGVGAVAFQQVTPSVMSLGPALAAVLAQKSAVASFPLGASLGGVWYGLFPAAPTGALVAGVTGGLAVVTAAVAAFAGIVADPVQRSLGIHRRRLHKMLDTLERNFRGHGPSAFVVRDHYAARLLDLVDVVRLVLRQLS
jgi:hypothetical protein